jgi:serine O-acetyltransferase
LKIKIGINTNFIHSFHGIFISEHAIIGNHCRILHHVTIGSNIQKNEFFVAPTIGNNVFIGCNCCIIGKTIIHDNCKIGAGVVITNQTIKSNSTVISNSFKILKNERSKHD